MSSFKKITRHPVTGLLKIAEWLDDYYGKHEYGIKFEGETGVYREEAVKDTRTVPTPEVDPSRISQGTSAAGMLEYAKPEVGEWEKEFDEKFEYLGEGRWGHHIKSFDENDKFTGFYRGYMVPDAIKTFIRSLLAAKTGEPLNEEAVKSWFKEWLPMVNADTYSKSFIAHFARPVVSREDIAKIINRNDDGDPLTDEKVESMAIAIHHLLEGKSVGVPVGEGIVWPKREEHNKECCFLLRKYSHECNCGAEDYNAAIDEFARLNPYLKRTEP